MRKVNSAMGKTKCASNRPNRNAKSHKKPVPPKPVLSYVTSLPEEKIVFASIPRREWEIFHAEKS
jgi:hypothetical protein